MNRPENTVEILGPGSLPGPYLLRQLSEAGLSGRQHSRRPPRQENTSGNNFPWAALDCLHPGDWSPEPRAAVISLLPLWLLPDLLPRLAQCRHLIAFGSTSLFTKTDSEDPRERALAETLASAEANIVTACREMGVPWTLLRPTLVYDEGRDQNVSAIARFVKRWGTFPIARPGCGLRQPVHAGDLARAALLALDNPKAFNRAFNLSGGETLTYRQMVERIFHALGRPPRILPVPLLLPEALFKISRGLRRSPYSPALFRRMNQDLCFDSSEAAAALGYAPRPFRPSFQHADSQK